MLGKAWDITDEVLRTPTEAVHIKDILHENHKYESLEYELENGKNASVYPRRGRKEVSLNRPSQNHYVRKSNMPISKRNLDTILAKMLEKILPDTQEDPLVGKLEIHPRYVNTSFDYKGANPDIGYAATGRLITLDGRAVIAGATAYCVFSRPPVAADFDLFLNPGQQIYFNQERVDPSIVPLLEKSNITFQDDETAIIPWWITQRIEPKLKEFYTIDKETLEIEVHTIGKHRIESNQHIAVIQSQHISPLHVQRLARTRLARLQ